MIARWWRQRLTVSSIRGVRGAITVDANTRAAIAEATIQLIEAMQEANAVGPDQVISAVFTLTPDLTAGFPAEAARQAGWGDVPLLCATEIGVPGALPRCLRVLVHAERRWTAAPRPVYLRGAVSLRPDLAAEPEITIPRITSSTPAASTR